MSEKSKAARSIPQVSPLIVGLDSATPAGGVALATAAGQLIASIHRESSVPASRRLMSDVDHLLNHEVNIIQRIKAVAVTHGPGMFTGLRVGLAVAKTLAHGWGVPLYGYSTLEIAARRWPVPGEVVCVLLDARRGELYSGVYRLGEEGRPENLRPDRVEPIEAILKDLSETDWPLIRFSGNGADLHREAIEQKLGIRARWIPAPWNGPGADALALAGAADWRAGRSGIDPLSAMPVYLRVSDAERRHPILVEPVKP